MLKSIRSVQGSPRSGPRFSLLRSDAVAAIVAVFFAATAVLRRHGPVEPIVAGHRASPVCQS